jgi:hypothetical protein
MVHSQLKGDKMENIWVIYDANGMRWTINAEEGRFYCIEAEEEMKANGTLFFDGTNQNGEYVYGGVSWSDLVSWLNQNGYMEK